MKINNGKIFILFGIIHALLGISPFAFGMQFQEFSGTIFFKISEGLLEFPILHGRMNYQNFAAFWFFYYGLLLIPVGILVHHLENANRELPKGFLWSYFVIVLIGAYMIPFSGMTIFMLPHAIYMLKYRNPKLQ
jgi:hypothetical protein